MIPRWDIPVTVNRLLVLPMLDGKPSMSAPYWKLKVWTTLLDTYIRRKAYGPSWKVIAGAGDVLVLPCQHDAAAGVVKVWDKQAHDWVDFAQAVTPLAAHLRIWTLSEGVRNLDLTSGTVEVLSVGPRTAGELAGLETNQLDFNDGFVTEPGTLPILTRYSCGSVRKHPLDRSVREVWACATIIEAPELPPPYVAHVPVISLDWDDDDDDEGGEEASVEPDDDGDTQAPVLTPDPEDQVFDMGAPPRLRF